LDQLFPRLILHGMLNLGCAQVMRFLGKHLTSRFGGQVVTDLRRGSEGVRLKHWINHNSIKLYNCLNVLRPETTIQDADDLRVYRTPESRPEAPMGWYPLRRAVADLYWRAQISRAANERYLTPLAAASVTTPLAQQAAKISRRLALLHTHRLIAKVSHTYRWHVTPKGRRILTALLAARQADTDKLISLAA
jgi:predicted NAD/FAD-binding protein